MYLNIQYKNVAILPREVGDGVLEGAEGVDVEVVGRLVQQEQVAPLRRITHPHTLSVIASCSRFRSPPDRPRTCVRVCVCTRAFARARMFARAGWW